MNKVESNKNIVKAEEDMSLQDFNLDELIEDKS